MPGRLAQFFTLDELNTRFATTPSTDGLSWSPRYNISPTTAMFILRISETGQLEPAVVRFGLLPAWSKDEKMCFHNARVESLTDKPSFREAFRKRRCILPLNGFYVWTEKGKVRLPHFVERADRGLLACAGLWERWVSKPDGRIVESTTLVTRDSDSRLLTFDDRMPLTLDSKDQKIWLDPNPDPDQLTSLMMSRDWPETRIYRVSRKVNSGKMEGPECIEPNDD
jgi:putative SOS response-associated peptidase YedK